MFTIMVNCSVPLFFLNIDNDSTAFTFDNGKIYF